MPLPWSSASAAQASAARKPLARLAILATIFHHVTTGYGAWTHWARDSHRTVAMEIGVWGNVGLTMLGLVAVGVGMGGEGRGRGVKRS